jgi:hypothetical protein
VSGTGPSWLRRGKRFVRTNQIELKVPPKELRFSAASFFSAGKLYPFCTGITRFCLPFPFFLTASFIY